jgi:hypothetical protein
MITPSIKALRTITSNLTAARRAKAILNMSRAELEVLPAAAARIRECYNPPSTPDLRMTVLDDLLCTHGVEAFRLRDGSNVMYLNAGDTYTPTIVRMRGNYYVRDWGSIAERHAAE